MELLVQVSQTINYVKLCKVCDSHNPELLDG